MLDELVKLELICCAFAATNCSCSGKIKIYQWIWPRRRANAPNAPLLFVGNFAGDARDGH